jgi:hypothetical protein
MKILIKNGEKYSRAQFKGYKLRVIFKLKIDNDFRNDSNVHIYTTDSDRERIHNTICDLTTDKVISCEAFHWATKEQDDSDARFIDETFKDL